MLSLEVATSEKQINYLDAVTHKQESPPHKRFFVRCKHLTLHATRRTTSRRFAKVWCKQCVCLWSVKTRRAPSRHFRDTTVYGLTTTTVHDMSTPRHQSWSYFVFSLCLPPSHTVSSRQLQTKYQREFLGVH